MLTKQPDGGPRTPSGRALPRNGNMLATPPGGGHRFTGAQSSRLPSDCSRQAGRRTPAYFTATMMKSTGLPVVFFDSCGVPRPMNWTSPRAQVVFAGFPSIERDILAGESAITTWS